MNRNSFFKKKLAGNSQFVFLLLLAFIFSLSFIDTARAKDISVGTSADNVGIGTTAPGAKLQVDGAMIVNGGSSSNWASINAGGGQSINAAGSIYSYNSICVSNGSGACFGSGGVVLGLTNTSAGINFPTSGNSFINNGGNVGIGTTGGYAKFQLSGNQLINGLTNGESSINANTFALQIGETSSRNAAANTYYSGIAFNHLLSSSYGTTYINSPQAWIGTRLYDTPGSERDYLVFATKPGTGVTGTGNDIPVERMVIDPLGNVGIGSTAPAFKLDVAGTGQFTQPVIVGTPTATNHAATKSYVDSTAASAATSAAGGGIGTGTSGQTLRHNGTSWVANSVLYNNGTNVGIGTSAPVTRAHVYGTLTVDPNGISNYYSEGIRIGTASNGYSVISYGANPASDTGYQANQWWTGKDGRDNGFNIWNASSGDVFHILSSGSVGIGTTAPIQKLDVNGQIHSRAVASNVDLTRIPGDSEVALSTGDGGGGQSAWIWRENYSSSNWGIFHDNNSNILDIVGSNTARLSVNLSSGSVGIGTTAPGATLDIQNSANAWATRGIRLLGPNMTAGSSLFITVGKADSPYNMGQMYFYQAGDNSTSNRLSFGLHSVDNVLNILGTGNVGIGPTAPAYKLDVAGAGQFTQPVIVGTPTAASHAATRSYVDSAVSSIWAVNGSSIYNSNSGNVGIGTNNPGYKLDVNGVINTASGLRVAGSAPSGYYLRGNGTNFVSSAIQPGDLPSNVYNLNQTYGSHNYGYSIGNGWYKIAETTFNGNCQSSNLVGDYQDLGYTTAARYIFNISTRGECDFTTNNESHHIDWNYQIDSTYDSNIDSKFRIVRTVNNTNSVKYELQVYVDTWDTGTWTFRTDGAWTIYSTQQTAGTPIASPTPKVNKLSNLNVYDGKLIAGSVGIGTTNPNQKLDVAGNILVRGSGTIYNNAGSGELQIGYGFASGGTAGSVTRLALQPYGHTGGPWKFISRDISSTAYLDLDYGVTHGTTLDSLGNVGIGTTAPNATLDIFGKLRFTSGGTIYNSDSTRWLDLSGSLADSLRAPGNLNMGGNLLFGNWSLSASSWPNAGGLGYNGGDVVFGISSGSGQASLAVDGGFQQREAGTVNYFLDKVGIGTTNPTSNLSVYSSTGSSSGNPLLRFSKGASPLGNIQYDTMVLESNDVATLRIGESDGTTAAITAGDLFTTFSSTHPIRFFTSGVATGLGYSGMGGIQRMIIDNAGNVGIGTTNPSGLLHVMKSVNDNSAFQGVIKIEGANSTESSNNNFNESMPAYGIEFRRWWTPGGVGYDNLQGGIYAWGANSWGSGLAFRTAASGGTNYTRMVIADGGNVGIGSTAPTAKFNVYQTGLYDSGTQRFVDITGEFAGTSASTNTNAGAFTGIRLGYVAAGKYAMIGSVSEDPIGYARQTGLSFWTSALDANPVERMRISNVGNVGIGTTNPVSKLEVVGDVKAQSFTYGSDRNLKYNINTIDNALTKILKLRGVTFNWKSDDSKSVGLIAQEVEQVFPELVSGTEGHKGVEYGNLVGPLIEAVKEQQKEIDNLQHRVLILEKKAVKKTK